MYDPTVRINQGTLCGTISTDIRGNAFYSFQGIPYAKPPVGKLRFKAPERHDGWPGVWDASKEGNECYQRHMVTKQIIGSEDCLNLNVYTPDLPNTSNGPDKLKPVMVWIHGGSFESGSNKSDLYGPEFLVAEDIVLVTINYRLGVLGLLAFEEPSVGVPGNATFKDMVMALRWVQENIVEFYGDPDNVTLFGNSAGAAAAHLIMLSPLAKGLFHRIIAQSGSALNIWVQGRKTAADFAIALGFAGANNQEMLEFLQTMPVEEIFKQQESISKAEFKANEPTTLGVVVEVGEEAFFSASPIELLMSGKYNKVPLMMGYTTMEGWVFNMISGNNEEHLKILLEDFETSVPHILGIPTDTQLSKEIGERIKAFYFGKENLTKQDMDTFYKLVGDNCIIREILRSVRYHAEMSSEPIYLYRMSVESKLNIMKRMLRMKKPGVCHGDELGYLFKNVLTPEIEPGSVEDVSQRRFAKLWSNFARCGNPNPQPPDPLVPVEWQPVINKCTPFLDIGTQLTPQVNPEQYRMDFWTNIFSLSPVYSKL